MNLYLECAMGAAGDMLASALLDLCENKEETLARLNALGLPHTQFICEEKTPCGLRALHLEVMIDGETETHDRHGSHHHGEHVHHHGKTLAEVNAVIDGTTAPEDVKTDAKAIYALVAEAEANVHGTTPGEVHFHELGMRDAIADVMACAFLIHELQPARITASPLNAGGGMTTCAHGVLPVPAPATALLLAGVPFYKSDAAFGELCTPTGAAVIKYYAAAYTDAPTFGSDVRIGTGCGTKEFKDVPNILRAYRYSDSEQITELACNVDDMTGEEIGFAAEVLLQKGALDAFVTPVMMKKGRPGYQLTVLCRDNERETFAALLFQHTRTIGIRCYRPSRYTLERTFREESGIRIKRSEGFGVAREKQEYEDLRERALREDISLFEAREKQEP